MLRDEPASRVPVAGREHLARLGSSWIAIAVLVVAAMVVYTALSLLQPIPGVFPDEFLYAHLARSLAQGNGFAWRGETEPLHAALYVYYLTPAWLVASGADAYHVAKVLSASFCALVAVPVWVVARRSLPPRLALVPAALVLLGTWMLVAGGLLTENLALPLATASLAATATALQEPRTRTSVIALAFALLAAWSRLQLVVLVPIVVIAHLADVARFGHRWRSRVAQHRAALLVGGGLLLAGLVAYAFSGADSAGNYATALHYRPSLGSAAGKTGLQLIQLAAMAGFIPLLFAFSLALQRPAWRHPQVGPLLVVCWVSTLLLALESGLFIAGNTAVAWGIERYMAYAVPLLLVLLVVGLTQYDFPPLRTLAGAVAATFGLLLAPMVGDISEERAVGATTSRVRDLLSSASPRVSLWLVATLMCVLVAVYYVVRKPGRSALAGVVIGTLFVVLVAQAATAWQFSIHLQRSWRTAFPRSLTWVDDHSRQPVAVLEVTRNKVGFEQYDFFNDRIAQYYATQRPVPGRGLQGRVCGWQIKAGGVTKFDDCGPVPQRFFINDPNAHLSFYNEVDEVRDPHAGRLVTVSGPPRVRSLVIMPCARPEISFMPPWGDGVAANAPHSCADALTTYVWGDKPATMLVKVQGGSEPHLVQVGNQRYEIAPERMTTLRLRVPAGGASYQIYLDWSASDAELPSISDVLLEQDGAQRSLL
jgi:hypothetical protein